MEETALEGGPSSGDEGGRDGWVVRFCVTPQPPCLLSRYPAEVYIVFAPVAHPEVLHSTPLPSSLYRPSFTREQSSLLISNSNNLGKLPSVLLCAFPIHPFPLPRV